MYDQPASTEHFFVWMQVNWLHYTVQYSTVKNSTVQYSTVNWLQFVFTIYCLIYLCPKYAPIWCLKCILTEQYCAVQFNIVQYSIVQYNTV